jgi:HSP20 family protein
MPEKKNAGAGKADETRQAGPGRPRPGTHPQDDNAEPKISAGATVRTAAGGAPVGFDALFSWLGGVVDQLGEAAGNAKSGEFVQHGEFKPAGLGEKARGVYGVRVKMGLGGKPSFEPFGNIHPTAKGPEVSDVREPMVDVFDEEDMVLVVAEMPGASEAEITMEVEGDVLKLRADGEPRYFKDVELPARVEPEPARKVYRNGLIELRFNKV